MIYYIKIIKKSYKKDKKLVKIRLFDFKIFIYSIKESNIMRPTLEEIDRKKSITVKFCLEYVEFLTNISEFFNLVTYKIIKS